MSALSNARAALSAAADGRRRREQLHPGAHPDGGGQWVEELPSSVCWQLLRAGQFGRLAFTAQSGAPVILPVNYVVHNQTIVIRTGPGPKLGAAGRADQVAFEIDEIDVASRTGWSVVVAGRARHVRAEAEREELDRLAIAPWAAGPRDEYVVIEPRHIAGRQLVAPSET
jgi:nitroimidazol reductase NimA-like FMN-containing flavoprotein (pyridoxamine 5'-phosphate oxidase superfamily)